MGATKILWGQILVVLLIVLMTIWSATQWTAWQLGFQPQLGQPWFELFGWPIYYPPAFFWWWYFYDARGNKQGSVSNGNWRAARKDDAARMVSKSSADCRKSRPDRG